MRILHLEDSPLDADLFRAILRREWPDCEIDVVPERESFVERVGRQHYDLILSDFSIAGFDGLIALQLARERAPEAPFIFLSGTIGEDRAVEAMRDGATDYVLKDRPKRLIPAIQRALAQAEQARAQRATEAQLLHAQRLENLGLLAAGIAHDFNNILQPVLIGIPLVRDQVNDPGIHTILERMEASVQRGASLVQQILGFVDAGAGRAQRVSPDQVIRELADVLRQTFPKAITIEEQAAADLWSLRANPTQLHQLFLNLCINARDAMPEGGTLRFTARNQELDPASAAEIPGARPGRYVVFAVADNGEGIAPADFARIWEPFFTTKERGRGTGLGLPTVRRIVVAHQGAITVQTEPGGGTTFTVYLPAEPDPSPAADWDLAIGPRTED